MNVGDCYIGWAKDESVRASGASGGLVSATLAAALEKGLVEKVLVLKKESTYDGEPHLTDSVEEVMQSAGSLHAVPAGMSKEIPYGVKVAAVGKPCDIRGVYQMALRHQLELDDVFLVGLNCGGTMPPVPTRQMLEVMYGLDPDEVVHEEIEKGQLIFTTKDGEQHAKKIDELEEAGFGRRAACRYCSVKIPRNADLACGNWGVPKERAGAATFVEVCSDKGAKLLQNAVDAGFVEIEPASDKSKKAREKVEKVMLDLSAKWRDEILVPVENRLQFYREALKHCILCNACKQVCPVCACGDESKCTTMPSSLETHNHEFYHLIRFLHIMDSCVGCGMCTDVCPAEIPISQLQARYSLPFQQEKGYVAGMNLERPPFFEVK
ncbi:MAG: Coenzyme F420 hydrogenase/dehydrogenase, beta subunit C-terminal domain [Methermicoccaceae archaeon]